ncbi:collagenase, partial [Streptomyces sp. NPDC001919]
MSIPRRVRASLLTSAVAVTLLASSGQTGVSAADTDARTAAVPAASTGAPGPRAERGGNPYDEVERLATAPRKTFGPAPAPG